MRLVVERNGSALTLSYVTSDEGGTNESWPKIADPFDCCPLAPAKRQRIGSSTCDEHDGVASRSTNADELQMPRVSNDSVHDGPVMWGLQNNVLCSGTIRRCLTC